jgi:hypothetical protein
MMTPTKQREKQEHKKFLKAGSMTRVHVKWCWPAYGVNELILEEAVDFVKLTMQSSMWRWDYNQAKAIDEKVGL